MARHMTSDYGKISYLKNNPREMSPSAFKKLGDSVEKYPKMLKARGIVIWRVPTDLSEEGETCPFKGQEGELVVLGGNQRLKELEREGYEKVPKEWLIPAQNEDGSWWTVEEASHFVLIDNNPDGIAGVFQYDSMIKNFKRQVMMEAGIDMANFPVEIQTEIVEEESVEDEVERDEDGEKDPELKEFIEKRERTRADLPELMETGYYLCLIFETHGQKMEFLEKAGLEDSVEYEMFTDGVEFAKGKMGIEIERSGLHFPDMRVDKQLATLAMENDQEPKEVSFAEASAGYSEESSRYGKVLEWISKVEGDGELGGENIPTDIRNRLKIFREWAESEKAFADGMIDSLKEEVEAEAEIDAEKAGVEKAFAAAAAERASVADVAEGDGDGDGEGSYDGDGEGDGLDSPEDDEVEGAEYGADEDEEEEEGVHAGGEEE